MAEKIGFELGIKPSNKTLDTLADVELELNDINKQLREAKKLGNRGVYRNLRQQQSKLKDESRKLNRELKDQKVVLGDLVDNFRIGFVRIGDFKAGIANTQKAMKVLTGINKAQILTWRGLAVAMASTGIGLLIIALGSLVAWLTQTQAGIDFVNRALASLEAGFSFIIETFARFKTEGFAAFKNFGANIKNAVVETNSLVGASQKLREERRALAVETQRVRTEEKELSKIAEDTSKSYAERSAAAAKGIKLESDLLAKREDFARRELQNIKDTIALKGELALAEDLDLIAEKEIELAQIREESVERQTTLNSKLNVANQGVKKSLDGIKEAAEGSLDALTTKLAALEKIISGGNLEGQALRDKIKEVLKLEQEVDNLAASLQRVRNEVEFGTGASPSLIDDPDGAGFGDGIESLDPALDPEVIFQKKVNDEISKQKTELDKELREKELAAQKARRELQQQEAEIQLELTKETYEQLGEALGEFASGDLDTLQDFSKKALGILVDFVSKQIELLLFAEQAKAVTNPASALKFALIGGVIKAILAKVKSTVTQLEDGGTLGFLADGPRHAHGGIRVGNQEIEGGEVVLTRRAADLFPDAINHINTAAGGRKILQEGGVLDSQGPVLPANVGSQGIDGDALAKQVARAVYMATKSGLQETVRLAERENEFNERNVA